MTTRHDLLELIENIKLKISDNEYKVLVEALQKLENSVSTEEHEKVKKERSKFLSQKISLKAKLEKQKEINLILMKQIIADNESSSEDSDSNSD